MQELKGISTLEISSPLEEYCPEDIYNFSLDLDLIIGSKGLDGGDFFL